MSGSQSGNWRQSDDWRSPAPSSSGSGSAGARLGPRDSRSGTSSYSQQLQRTAPCPQQRRLQSVGQDQLRGQAGASADDAQDSISEGRRIYLGNLLYRVKPDEIEKMLVANGFEDKFEAIHISVDAVTGRNPGYCFIDFKKREDATIALDTLGGIGIQGRPAKVGPCQPKGAEKRWKSDDYKPAFQRWGDWTGPKKTGFGREGGAPVEGVEQGPYGAIEHLHDVRRADRPPRVFLGGIGKMINQEEHDREIRGYLEGFKIVAISKRITPHPSTRAKPGNHHYCFVDFESMEEAEAAVETLNGRVMSGGKLRVQIAGRLPDGIGMQ